MFLFKKPKNDARYVWTNHVVAKMAQYKISESLIKRIVRFPKRVEEGIADNTVAVMKPPEFSKKKEEIWVMYQLAGKQATSKNQSSIYNKSKIKIITTWRYPGVSPSRDPIPKNILDEVRSIINF